MNHPLRQYLEPFIPLLRKQQQELSEEASTNREFHLGPKQYDYIKTLTGDQPVKDNDDT